MEIYLSIITLLSQILGAYAIAAVFVYSGGAWGSLDNLRNSIRVKEFGLLECFLCTSFWSSLFMTLIAGGTWQTFFIVWGAAYVIDQLVMAYKLK